MFNYCAIVAPRNPEKQGHVPCNQLFLGNYCVAFCELLRLSRDPFYSDPNTPPTNSIFFCCSGEVKGESHAPGRGVGRFFMQNLGGGRGTCARGQESVCGECGGGGGGLNIFFWGGGQNAHQVDIILGFMADSLQLIDVNAEGFRQKRARGFNTQGFKHRAQ